MLTNNTFTPLAFVLTCAFVVFTCHATVISSLLNPSILHKSSLHLIFREKCEDRWNKEKDVTETCCKGNYKCSSDICQTSKLCKFGFVRDWMWCHSKHCIPTNKNDDKKDDKDDEDGKPQPSTEHNSDGHDKKESDGKDREKDSDSKGDKTQENTPTPTPTPSNTPKSTTSSNPSKDAEHSLHCEGRRDRQEIRDMTPEQRRQWQEAIMALRADRDENGNSEWDRLVQLHMDFNDEAHGGSYFLPWHRLFLLRLENALRKYQPNLALPYWDWAQDAADAALSPAWDEDSLGGARRGNQPIQSGTFKGMNARRPVEHVIQRDFTSGVSGEIPLLWGISPLDQLTKEEAWGDFTDGIEAAHALPHIYIGGDMSDAFRAPNDPTFYLHHGFIDWLWTERQKSKDPNQFGGTHDFAHGTENAQPGRVFEAFGVPTKTAFNLHCVHYVSPNRPHTNSGGRGTRGTKSELGDPCADLPEHTISNKRCKNGWKVLEGDSS